MDLKTNLTTDFDVYGSFKETINTIALNFDLSEQAVLDKLYQTMPNNLKHYYSTHSDLTPAYFAYHLSELNNQKDALIDSMIFCLGALYKLQLKYFGGQATLIYSDQDIRFLNQISNLQFDTSQFVQVLNQMFNRVSNWNKTRHNDDFDAQREFGFLLEEQLEFNCAEYLPTNHEKVNCKQWSRDFMHDLRMHKVKPSVLYDQLMHLLLSYLVCAINVYHQNKDLNQIIEQFSQDFKTVMDANDHKGMVKDANGKIVKDASFIPPENSFVK